MKRIIKVSLVTLLLSVTSACSDFMNIVPDNVATIDQAFRMRSTAERFLFTCYSYMPSHGTFEGNPAFAGGDEFWLVPGHSNNAWQIARGNQKVVNPYMNFWQGGNGGKDLYEGIRQTNIFLENIDDVPGMEEAEKSRWIAEAKFLKAYYHFWLARMHGPIILIKENLPVSASGEAVNRPRSSVDSVFTYVVELLDEAAPDLPDRIANEVTELGRITRTMALSVKAQVLLTAASPLFNGNQDYAGYTGPDGEKLFNTTLDPDKWQQAADAAKEAIELAESQGHELYYFEPEFSQYDLSDTTLVKMSIRNSVAEKWNAEIIWGNTNSMASGIQGSATPRGLDPDHVDNSATRGSIAPPLKIAEMFYSSNGVPITEDKTWNYSDRFSLKTASDAEKYNLKEGYTTAALHFDREPRFYASLAFDGGIWYGQGHFNDDGNDVLFVSSKKGQPAAPVNLNFYSVTGYWPKKLVNYNNIIGNGNSYTVQEYPWPVIRLADLYLMYAEALNEVSGPGPEVYKYLNLVRERAGIPPVEQAWTNHSSTPDKYTTKDGLREIIHHERLIEFAFEGKRFWDLRRWKEAAGELNQPITGWDLDQEDAEGYYRERHIFDQRFTTRDYLWPLNENVILSNTSVEQNPGW